MSWLARSIANTLKFDETDGDQSDAVVSNLNEDDTKNPKKQLNQNDSDSSSSSSPTSTPRGVKDDISELKKTLTRQFWGVASFLAPPPQSEPYKPLLDSESKDPDGKSIPGSTKDESESDPAGITGIRNDFAEIGGKFMTGISMFSNNVAVSEITKMASNFLQLESDNEEEGREGNNALPSGGAVGVTDEVVSFARDIAMHPETWLDFPLPEDDDDDFDVSDAQQEHALAVEQLAPRLAALRIELCPGYMSESCFWKIYFVLLHPRLDKTDAELLSTPQIVKARALLSHELKNRTKANLQDWSGEGTTDVQDISNNQHEEPLSVPTRTDPDNMPKTSFAESATFTAAAELEMEKHPIMSTEIAVSDKSVIEEKYIDRTNDQNMNVNSYNVLVEKDEDDADDWLKEETSEVGASGATIPIENEEDVSFSDLEEDDVDVPSSFKKTSNNSDKDTRDWVQLRKGSADSSDSTESRDAETAGSKKVNHIYPDSNETHDWLDVDDIDVA